MQRYLLLCLLILLCIPLFIACKPGQHTLLGQVVDARNNAPLAGAQVTIEEQQLATGEDGRYSVPLKVGDYQVQVSAPGYLPRAFTIHMTENTRSFTNDVILERQMLRSIVRDKATDAPIADARVEYNGAEATTDKLGFVELEAVEGQPLRVSSPGYLPVEVPADRAQAGFTPTKEPLIVTLTPRVLAGTVTDAKTGRPAADVIVSAGEITATTDAQGQYELDYVEPGMPIKFAHAGYKTPSDVTYNGQEQVDASLEPFMVIVTVLDAGSGAPLAKASVSSGDQTAETDEMGRVTLRAIPSEALSVQCEGYKPQKLAYQGEETLEARLEGSRLTGTVRNAQTQEALAGAAVQVFTGDNPTPEMFTTDDRGTFVVDDGLNVTKVAVKMPGYKLTAVPISQLGPVTIDLEPFVARALYVPFGLLSLPDYIDELLDIVSKSDLNAIVVDVKSDAGRIAWDSPNPLAKDAGAYFPDLMPLQDLAQKCRERDIYTIARQVVFKDDILAAAHPEWAVTTKDGAIYKDYSEQRWLDAYLPEGREYNIALALEISQMGFDEIQFDYIRFPTEGKLNWRVYAKEDTEENRSQAINEFLAQAYAAIRPTPVFLSADIFGLNVWVKLPGDNNVGQRLEELAQNLDYISPMVYPSTFWTGNLGFNNPSLYPYEIVYRSVLAAQSRTKTLIRPWLQHYSSPGVEYGPLELMKERRGAEDANSAGWMFWNARGRYQTEVFSTEEMKKYADALARSIAQEEAVWNSD